MQQVRLLLLLLGLGCSLVEYPALAAGGFPVSFSLSQEGVVTRIVLGLPRGLVVKTSRQGYVERIGFSRAISLIGSSTGVGQNVRSVSPSSTNLSISVCPDCTVKISQAGNWIRMDVAPGNGSMGVSKTANRDIDSLRKSSEEPLTSARSVLPGLPAPLVAVVDAARVGTVGPQRQVFGQGDSIHADDGNAAARDLKDPALATVARSSGPVSVVAGTMPDRSGSGRDLLLPFDRAVGAAAYRQNNRLVVVFDSEKPVDLSAAAQDPVYQHASYSLLQGAAVLTVPLAVTVPVAVQRQQDGWLVAVGSSQPQLQPIGPSVDDGLVRLTMSDSGHVVVVPGASGGTDLLVGTTRRSGQAVLKAHHGVDYELKATLLGVAVERLSDTLELRPTSSGFVLLDPAVRSSHSVGRLRPEQEYSRVLDLAQVSGAELQRRYNNAVAAAAAAPPAARRAARLDAAEAALGLDRGREAAEIADIADQDAPGEPDAARSRFLHAAGLVLIDGQGATAELEDPMLGNSDEVELWRALDKVRHEPKDAGATRAVAEHLPLLQAYPDPLRRHLLGTAALALTNAATSADADPVLRLSGGGKVALAQALINEQRGMETAALLGFDRAVTDPDPAVAARAAEEAVSLRLKRHLLSVSQALKQLEGHVLDARMAGDELPIRLKIADLRAEQHDWPAALATLREIIHDFPGAGDEVQRRVVSVLQALGEADPTASALGSTAAAAGAAGPIAQLALLQNNLDLLPPGKERSAVTLALAARLEALDLADQAAAVVKSELDRSDAGPGRAELGLELARLQLDENNHAAAALALDATEDPGLPEPLVTARALVRARAAAAAGDPATALRLLQPLHGAEAETLRARESAATHDWAEEEVALTRLAALTLPQTGPLDGGGEDLVLRLGGAAARAGDQTTLRQLEPLWKNRFPDGTKLAMLRLLASPGTETMPERPGLKNELAVARAALPAVGAAADKNGN